MKPQELAALLRHSGYELLITAHTHVQLHREIEGVDVVNPGPVCGLTFTDEPVMPLMAQYVLCDYHPSRSSWRFIFRQVPFDVVALRSRLATAAREEPAFEWTLARYQERISYGVGGA